MLTYINYKYEGCTVQHQIYGIGGQENMFLCCLLYRPFKCRDGGKEEIQFFNPKSVLL